MTTTISPRAGPPGSRRLPQSSSPTPAAPSIARGATARSAASPRVTSSLNSAAARRPSVKGRASSPSSSGETRESLSASLKQETEQKEHLLVQIQDKDQTIGTLSTENTNLTSALNAAEVRLNELYAEQSRSEMEMAQRMEVSEKLRTQVRELEKERRDIQRRYNEQTASFDAERQAFYDNEQHLKSRIQSLTQARKQPDPPIQTSDGNESESDFDVIESQPDRERPETPKQDLNDPDQEPAEMTSLRLELSTLSTSYSSLQSTLVLLQTQLVDLKRVNHELQEENESYMILLRERTLSGQFNVMKQVGAGSSDGEDDVDDDGDGGDVGSLRSTTRSTLDRVDEEQPEESLDQELQRSLEPLDSESISSHNARTRQGRKRGASTSHSPGGAPRGESLADLPITGPGLDLAAELGRAENKDILEGNIIEDSDRSVLNKSKRARKDSHGKNLPTSGSGGLEASASTHDIDALRAEVKGLKDANKALSLYASKIIDRIISQEGFEHVLAVDYDKEPETPSTAVAAKPPTSKPRPQSVIVGSSSNPAQGNAFKFSTPPLSAAPKLGSPPNPKVQRRSMSFDWKSFSIFNAEKKPDANLRPLTLKPGASPVTGARKLETQEDEEDRKERERLNATMKLMGIQPSPQAPAPIQKAFSSPGPAPSSPAASNRRFSFWGKSTDNSETSSVKSTPSLSGSGAASIGLGIDGTSSLTQEALEHAEAENSLAALDAHERTLSAEIARGSSGGFTEIAPRGASGRRSRRSAGGGSGSGSTVWSAGLSGTGEDED